MFNNEPEILWVVDPKFPFSYRGGNSLKKLSNDQDIFPKMKLMHQI